MSPTDRKRLVPEIIEEFDKKRVLVVGDSILDAHVFGRAIGKSAETPTIVGKEEKTEYSYGGAGCVVANLLELGSWVTFVTLLGNDETSLYYDKFCHPRLSLLPIRDAGRTTTVKKRFWIDGYKLLQLDQMDNRDIDLSIQDQVISSVEKILCKHDTILLVDYRHGMMTKSLIDRLKVLAAREKVRSIASSQVSQRDSNHLDYAGVDFICLNFREARQVDPSFSTEGNFKHLQSILDANVCVTLGKEGTMMLLDNGEVMRVPGIEVQEIDSCGAGDSFLALFSLSDPSLLKESLYLSNCWAGLSVTKRGTTPPGKQELLNYVYKSLG